MKKSLQNISKNTRAISYMLLAMFCLSAMNIAIREVSGSLPSTEIVVFRHIFSIIIVFCWATWISGSLPKFTSKRLKGHFWRSAFGICAMELWFYSVSIMSVNLVTALSFTTPIFSTIFAIVFLGEKAGIRRWSAIFVGFIGMLIILRPDASGISNAGWIVIVSSVLMAASGIMVKTLTSSESPETIVFYMAVFMLCFALPLAIPAWQPFNITELAICFIIALCSSAAHLLMARSFILADIVVLTPFDFTRLIFTAILAYIFFGETIDTQTVIGSLVIASSAIYIAHREANKKRLNAQEL